jgi:hypothetical protein
VSSFQAIQIWKGIFSYFKIRGESEEVAITKVVSNYTFFLHKFSRNFSPNLAIFPLLIQFLAI